MIADSWAWERHVKLDPTPGPFLSPGQGNLDIDVEEVFPSSEVFSFAGFLFISPPPLVRVRRCQKSNWKKLAMVLSEIIIETEITYPEEQRQTLTNLLLSMFLRFPITLVGLSGCWDDEFVPQDKYHGSVSSTSWHFEQKESVEKRLVCVFHVFYQTKEMEKWAQKSPWKSSFLMRTTDAVISNCLK